MSIHVFASQLDMLTHALKSFHGMKPIFDVYSRVSFEGGTRGALPLLARACYPPAKLPLYIACPPPQSWCALLPSTNFQMKHGICIGTCPLICMFSDSTDLFLHSWSPVHPQWSESWPYCSHHTHHVQPPGTFSPQWWWWENDHQEYVRLCWCRAQYRKSWNWRKEEKWL